MELLARHAVARLNERYGFDRRLSAEALQLLQRFRWPGNVRQLLHVIESAAILCDGEILPEHLPAELHPLADQPAAQAPGGAAHEPLPSLEQVERAHIERVLQITGGHRGRAAKVLGISERNLYRKIEEYRLGQGLPSAAD